MRAHTLEKKTLMNVSSRYPGYDRPNRSIGSVMEERRSDGGESPVG